MELVVISSTLMSFFLIVLLLGYFGRKADEKKKRLESINEVQANVVYDEFNESLYKRFISPWLKGISRSIAKWVPKLKGASNKDEVTEKQLRLAGLYLSVQEFNSIRMIISGLLIVIFVAIGLAADQDVGIKFMIILFGLILAFLIPNYFIKAKISSRQKRIREQLPEVLDLLGACIEAGLSFDGSLLKISEKLKGPFVDELLILHREIQMGRQRRDALRNLGECSNIPELKTFANSMAQSDQLGIPINNVLKVQAAQLRVTRKQQAQEKGLKAPVKMMLPMVAFVFPVIFIILLGPTIIQLIEQFG